MKMKYVLHPGNVTSKEDGDKHYIPARDLAKLYGVNWLECYVSREGLHGCPDHGEPEGAIHLYPDPTGQYQLPGNGVERAIRRLENVTKS